jgi:hypothetical protein
MAPRWWSTFYHKALQGEKTEEIKESNFRYEGPLPDTREAAIVMLADSIEAAVRAMPEKTTGKIEGLVRKIIKDKLDDGQLDRCDLTLKDLSIIADSFLTVLSGIFHERPEYPEFEKKNALLELDNKIYNITHEMKKEGGVTKNEANPIQQAEEGKAPPEVRKLLERAGRLCLKMNGFSISSEVYVTLTDNESMPRSTRPAGGSISPPMSFHFPC